MRGILLIGITIVATVVLWGAAVTATGGVLLSYRGAAQIMGILGLMGVSWASILSIRHSVLEELFGGLDRAYRVHHIVGGVAFILIINHPLLLVIDSLPANTLRTYLLPSPSLSYALGVLALYLLLILLVLTLFVDLPYKLWKQTHEWMGVVILMGGLHAYLVPSGLANFALLRIWIVGWGMVALMSYLYKRFGYYRLAQGARYRIEQVTREGEMGIIQLVHDGVGRPLNFAAGQYAFFALPDKERDEHPFSILSQVGARITIGFKTIGPFTYKAFGLKTGTSLVVRGPHGTFAQVTSTANEMVWVAGGIGITPFASMATAIRPQQHVTLSYTTQEGGPKMLTQAFRRFAEMTPNFHLIEHVSQSAGHLTAQVVLQKVAPSKQAYFLLCGPRSMMEDLTQQLIAQGVKRKRIIYEDFSLK